MIQTRIRQDLLNANLMPPTHNGFVPTRYRNQIFRAVQPDCLDDAEYNMVIFTENNRMFFVNSIDFEDNRGE
jgi:hypothetical protein